ncbi:tRNA(Ile)-lysidine synthase [Botrimarina hoheduenensis]|uniref:tRNA(Ile)-lysidine synthase n=1 Tax=Botrimarina hoheduenensis TaxID=2528000 RepID=A0A5C5VV95_9BACT|nr:tRNA(Ile)-lysidine synthase [Botrimarina hoheduenensis]
MALLQALLAAREAGSSGDATAPGRIAAAKGEIHVAHFDHCQRGEESTADAAWVRALCARLGVKYHQGQWCSAEHAPSPPPRASEAVLRGSRRRFLVETANQIGARCIVLAHHADDQAETVLFRALRGAGLHGLSGIRPFVSVHRGLTIVRPLLAIPRADLLAYLANLGSEYRIDSTNATTEATRNWIRQVLLPAAEERFPAAAEALGRLAEQAAEHHALIVEQAAQLCDVALLTQAKSTEAPATLLVLRAGVLRAAPEPIAREALRILWRRAGWPEQAMTATHWRALGEWATQAKREVFLPVLPSGIVGEIAGEHLRLIRAEETDRCD